jgi:type IV pilus assembly protein PilV
MLNKQVHNRRTNTGFTLIEVLIAMFVLSVGMLGSTGLMLQGRAGAVNTNYEAKALQMTLGIAEQMRANIVGVQGGNYNALKTASASDPGCIAAQCSTAQMAAYDAYIWKQALSSNLPSGAGEVNITTAGANDDSIFTITVNWSQAQKNTGSKDTGSLVNRTYTMVFQP